MKRFFLRELRRLAPAAIAVLGLGVVVALLILVLSSQPLAPVTATIAGVGLVCIAAPFVLAVVTVAPDVESGAVGFLATLPVSPARQLAVRWAAALAWTSLLVALAATVGWAVQSSYGRVASSLESLGRFPSAELVTIAMLGLASGLAASCASRTTLGALVATPLVGLAAPIAFMSLLDDVFGMPLGSRDESFIFCGTAGVLVLTAGIAFTRGDVQRPSRRALVLTLVTLFVSLVASGGVATSVYGYYCFTGADLWISPPSERSADGRVVVLPRSREARYGPLSGEAWDLVDLDRGARSSFAGPWPVIALSPSGRTLVRSRPGALEVSSLETGAVVLEPMPSAHQGPGPWREGRERRLEAPRQVFRSLGSGAVGAILWSGETPWFALHDGTIVTRRATRTLPAGFGIESASTTRLLLVGPAGERRLLDATGERPVAFAGKVLEARLAPSGERALVLSQEEGELVLRVCELSGGTSAVVVRGKSGLPLEGRIKPEFSPSERWLLLRATASHSERLVLFDRSSPRTTPVVRGGGWSPVAGWSPDESRLVLSDRVVVELEGTVKLSSVADSGFTALGFVDEDRVLLSRHETLDLVVADRRDGQVRPWVPTNR